VPHLESELERHKHDLGVAKKKHADATEREGELEQRARELESEIRQRDDQIAQLSNELANQGDQSDRISELEAENEDLAGKLRDAESEVASLQSALEEASAEAKKLESLRSALRRHLVGWRHFSDAAPAGSTGNNTHAGVAVDGYEDVVTLVLEFIVSAIGATPTVSFKWQGALEGPEVSDAASNWFDLDVLPEGTATEAVTQTVTTVGAFPSSVEIARRPVRKIRLVTSANTNVTYGPCPVWADVTAE
jgi:hypothetical protein